MNALVKPRPTFTSAEFHRMAAKGAFSGLKVELRRGMILKMSPKYVPHLQVQADLFRAIAAAVDASGFPWAVGTEGTITYGGGFDPMPDLVVYEPGAIADPFGPLNPQAVRLVVEVSDTTLDDDLGEKLEDYARAGLAEYWVADVKGRRLIQHAEPVDGAYVRRRELTLDAALEMLTQPGLVVKIPG
jgi:Uma2 family endonuclease